MHDATLQMGKEAPSYHSPQLSSAALAQKSRLWNIFPSIAQGLRAMDEEAPAGAVENREREEAMNCALALWYQLDGPAADNVDVKWLHGLGPDDKLSVDSVKAQV
jgi:hypothetical protein